MEIMYALVSFSSSLFLILEFFLTIRSTDRTNKRRFFTVCCLFLGISYIFDGCGSLFEKSYETIWPYLFFDLSAIFLSLGVYSLLIFSEYSLKNKDVGKNWFKVAFFIPYLVAILIALNVFGKAFSIDSSGYNLLLPGQIGYGIIQIPVLCCLIKALVFAFRKENFLHKKEFLLISFLLFVTITPVYFDVLLNLVANTNSNISTLSVFHAFALVAIYQNNQHNLIVIDPLTGIGNRNAMYKNLSNKVKQHNDNLYLFMLDIDNFKEVNDKYGRSSGDEALILVADTLKTVIPRKVQVCRIGGDEFSLIGEFVNDEDAEIVVSLIHKKFNIINSTVLEKWKISVTVSYLSYDETMGNIQDFVLAAEKKLYETKNS